MNRKSIYDFPRVGNMEFDITISPNDAFGDFAEASFVITFPGRIPAFGKFGARSLGRCDLIGRFQNRT